MISIFQLYLTYLSSLELNTFTIPPSVLCCACVKAALRGLGITNSSSMDKFISENIHCKNADLIHIQRMIEQFLQTCIHELHPLKQRHCLAPIDNTMNKSTKSPRVK